MPQAIIDIAKNHIEMPMMFGTVDDIRKEISNLENEIKLTQKRIDEKLDLIRDIEERRSEIGEWLKSIGEYENTNK